MRDAGTRIYYSFNGESIASAEPRDVLMRKAEMEMCASITSP
jgi:hypothetical protein